MENDKASISSSILMAAMDGTRKTEFFSSLNKKIKEEYRMKDTKGNC
jgi:hypothetical protein